MTTDPTPNEIALVGDVDPTELPSAASTGRSGSSLRRLVSLSGQYLSLGLLALVVLTPLFLTLIQALSPPLSYLAEGKPLHPVDVDWKDRTWFTGGPVSVVGRTLIVVAMLAWLQRVGSPYASWFRDARSISTPRRLFAIVGGTVALTVALGPVFGSLHAKDGSTAGLVAVAVVALAVTQFVGFHEPGHRGAVVAVISAVAVALLVVAAATIFFGAAVWTQSWASAGMGPAMQRSLVMSVLITVAQVVTSILAAYAFVFLDFPFKRILFVAALATLLLPLEVTLVGNIALIRQLGWIDSMQGLVLPFAASAMGIFLIRQGFRGIPKDIQDAVRIDGHGHLTFLVRYAIPLTRPVIASFTVIAALQAWNQYLWPRSIIETSEANTLQIALQSAISENIAQANVTVAAALVSAVPVGIMLVAFQRHIIRGLTAGAVK